MIILILLLIITGCFDTKVQKLEKKPSYRITNSHGTFRVYIQKHFIFDKEGIASFYNTGKVTATCEPFIPNYLTAAHPYLPLPCIAEVSLVSNPSKKVIVKINDRGPFTKQKRIIDLSYGAAKELDMIKSGIAKVRVKVLIKETLKLKEHGGRIKWKGEKYWHHVK